MSKVFESQIKYIKFLENKHKEIIKKEYEKLIQMKREYNKHCDTMFNSEEMTEKKYKVLFKMPKAVGGTERIYEGPIPNVFEPYMIINVYDGFNNFKIKLDESVYDIEDEETWTSTWILNKCKDESHNGDYEKIMIYNFI